MSAMMIRQAFPPFPDNLRLWTREWMYQRCTFLWTHFFIVVSQFEVARNSSYQQQTEVHLRWKAPTKEPMGKITFR